jgi:hypothetical protein
MPVAPLPDVEMSAVELMVTVLVLLDAEMPLASVVMIANGPGLMFSVTAPLLSNSTPVTPDAGAMLVVRLLTLRMV